MASPRDVVEERELLEEVIRDLNITWGKTVGINLELVKWETNAYPGIGVDSQSVINDQIADDYDIFIGIMWARFGTATQRAESGTAEEFSRALERYKTEPDQIRIMFYFKDQPISPSDIDIEQLGLVKKFQKEIGAKGTLYWNYSDRDEFARLVRMHLSQQVQEWNKSWGLKSSNIAQQQVVQEALQVSGTEPAVDEDGYLDLLEIGQEKFSAMNDGLMRMTTILKNFAKKVTDRSQELNQAATQGQKIDLRQAKKVSDLVAEDMNTFAVLMDAEIPVFAGSYSSAVDAYTRAFNLEEDSAADPKY